jgi:hypothetical protein
VRYFEVVEKKSDTATSVFSELADNYLANERLVVVRQTAALRRLRPARCNGRLRQLSQPLIQSVRVLTQFVQEISLLSGEKRYLRW